LKLSEQGPSLRRLAAGAAIGIVVGGVLTALVPWQLAITLGWCAAALTLILRIWLVVGFMSVEETRSHATAEDNGRNATRVLLVAASVASLGGAAAVLVKASQTSGAGKFALAAAGVGTVLVSWTLVHSVFTLRYAHEFYTEPVGGIDFKTDKEMPDYRDFAYVAFTVGMTFQVSDTDIQSRVIRRSVLRQALLSYLFGAIILAVTVNIIASVIT